MALPIHGAKAWCLRFPASFFGPDGLGDIGESLARDNLRELVGDPLRYGRAFVNHRGVELHQACSGTDPLECVLCCGDAACADQRHFSATRTTEIAQTV